MQLCTTYLITIANSHVAGLSVYYWPSSYRNSSRESSTSCSAHCVWPDPHHVSCDAASASLVSDFTSHFIHHGTKSSSALVQVCKRLCHQLGVTALMYCSMTKFPNDTFLRVKQCVGCTLMPLWFAVRHEAHLLLRDQFCWKGYNITLVSLVSIPYNINNIVTHKWMHVSVQLLGKSPGF